MVQIDNRLGKCSMIMG
ncbi:hypothetical protein F383_36180 [Gossypium arboreum]|uniref:Uncharacterized protein n=1 Tax=Gossypium arboreum TaxID=29729 RepID=A0A0B0PXY7_GOSAR|nr:hypothetical protein F383_36180 [Gossypium arboreum]